MEDLKFCVKATNDGPILLMYSYYYMEPTKVITIHLLISCFTIFAVSGTNVAYPNRDSWLIPNQYNDLFPF